MRAMTLGLLAALSIGLIDADGCGDPPTAEVCNGKDDDGNGQVDDNLAYSVEEIAPLTLDFVNGTGSATYYVCGDTGTIDMVSQGLGTLVFGNAEIVSTSVDGDITLTEVRPTGASGRITATWTFTMDGAYDSSGLYGSVAEGRYGTLLWAYNVGQVFPFPVGQDEAVLTNNIGLLNTPPGSTAYVSGNFNAPGNVYQISVAVDKFQAPILAGSTEDYQTTFKLVLGPKATGAPQVLYYGLAHLQAYEDIFGPYLGANGNVAALVSVDWCETGATSCAYGGVEEHDKYKVSYSNLNYQDSYGGDAPVTSTQYYSGLGVNRHELGHAFGPGGLHVRPKCIADFLALDEGWASYIADVIGARTDAFHSELAFHTRHVSGVDYYIAQRRDMVVWPTTCDETPGSVPSNYATITYERGAAFWYDYAQLVGPDNLLAWAVDIHQRALLEPNMYALTGDELLDDAAAFTGLDARNAVVSMLSGATSDLATGWLRTKNDRPITTTVPSRFGDNTYVPLPAHPFADY